MQNNIITMLTTEHREVAALFEQLDKTTDRAEKKRAEIFAKIDHDLSIHADFEEAEVYPLLEAEKETQPIALEAVEEHLQIKRLLAELRDLEPRDPRWFAKATVLMENVRHHVKEEENEALPKLKKQASQEDLQRLGEEYAKIKETKETKEAKETKDTKELKQAKQPASRGHAPA